jgi:hypothetical protein
LQLSDEYVFFVESTLISTIPNNIYDKYDDRRFYFGGTMICGRCPRDSSLWKCLYTNSRLWITRTTIVEHREKNKKYDMQLPQPSRKDYTKTLNICPRIQFFIIGEFNCCASISKPEWILMVELHCRVLILPKKHSDLVESLNVSSL